VAAYRASQTNDNEELKDGLQFAGICKSNLRKQAKGLCKVHLRDCLIDAQTKKQHKQIAAIKRHAIGRKASACGT
jgi:hypothetical protein